MILSVQSNVEQMIPFKQHSIEHVSHIHLYCLQEFTRFCIKSRNAYQVRFLFLSIIVALVAILIRLCHNLPGERDNLISTLTKH